MFILFKLSIAIVIDDIPFLLISFLHSVGPTLILGTCDQKATLLAQIRWWWGEPPPLAKEGVTTTFLGGSLLVGGCGTRPHARPTTNKWGGSRWGGAGLGPW